MNDNGNNGSGYSIKYPCPSGTHSIESACQAHTLVLVPDSCPVCGMGLPEGYRMRVREILNIMRFQDGQSDGMLEDIEILSA